MVARGEDAAAALAKARDALTVGHGQTVARVNGEEPQFVEVCRVEPAQHFVVAVRVRLAVARRDFAESAAFRVFQSAQMLAEQREPADVPVVLGGRDGGLQKDADRAVHTTHTIFRSTQRRHWPPPANSASSLTATDCRATVEFVFTLSRKD